MTHEIKKVIIGGNSVEAIAFDTFFELTLGGLHWGQPQVKVMMSHAHALELVDAIVSVVNKVGRTAAQQNAAAEPYGWQAAANSARPV